MVEEGQALEILKTKHTCSITARDWGEEREAVKGSPTEEGQEEVVEGEEEAAQLLPQVQKTYYFFMNK